MATCNILQTRNILQIGENEMNFIQVTEVDALTGEVRKSMLINATSILRITPQDVGCSLRLSGEEEALFVCKYVAQILQQIPLT
jgi:hypothetical protein